MSAAILIALNDSFVPSMKVFLHSLVKSNPYFGEDILILEDDNLSNKNLDLLKRIYSNLRTIKVKKEDYVNCKACSRPWGFNLYYRFDVFDLVHLNYDKIIMLDSDMLIMGNIDELIACEDDFAACRKYLSDNEIEKDDTKIRFNCGLMVLSRKILNPRYKKEMINLAQNKIWSSDQSIFNKVFEDIVTYLPQKYNVALDLLTDDLMKSGVIFHFVGDNKPYGRSLHQSFDPNIVQSRGRSLMSAIYYKLKVIENEVNKLYV